MSADASRSIVEAMRQPHSLEAEQAVLGALLMDNDAFDRVSDVVRAEEFWEPQHRAIWTTLVTLITARKPADVVTVFDSGGHDMTYLAALLQSVPSSASARRYAQIVHDRHLERELIRAAGDIAADAVSPGADVLAKIDRAQTRLATLGEVRRESEPVGIEEAVVSWSAHLQAEAEGRSRIFPTGLRDLDRLLGGGLREGELMVLGARPKMGKTALMLAMQRAMAQDYSTLVLSQEMPVNELMSRHAAAVGRINLSDLRRPDQANDDVWERVADAMERLGALHMAFDDTRALTLLDVRRKAMQAKRRRGLDVMFVDFLQLMAGDGDNRNQELDKIANGLKALGGELKIGVVLLSQLSREADKRSGPPVMTDLRDSGAIEAAADVIALLYREAAHPLGARGAEWEHFAQLEVVQRNGAPGQVGLHFDGAQQRFGDWAGAWPKRIGGSRSTGYAKGGLS